MIPGPVVDPELAIPERNIAILSPHYDDVPCMLGGWLLSMRASGALAGRRVSVRVVFSRSNYFSGDGDLNYTASRERIALVTGTRLLEDQACLDELIGAGAYDYSLGMEDECLVRGNKLSVDGMEFPHGMEADFDDADRAILERTASLVQGMLSMPDTAIVAPLAYREHRDHFIVREAVAKAVSRVPRSGARTGATVYYQEDKPYAGLASDAEKTRVDAFAETGELVPSCYPVDPAAVAELVERHYPSQFEEIYRKGILHRAEELALWCGCAYPLDRVFSRK